MTAGQYTPMAFRARGARDKLETPRPIPLEPGAFHANFLCLFLGIGRRFRLLRSNGQSRSAGCGNLNPFPLSVAPGQLLTLFVQPTTAISPVSSSAVSAVYSVGGTDEPMPVLQLVPTSTACNFPIITPCTQILALTVQVPFDIQVICPLCARPPTPAGDIVVSINGLKTPAVGIQGVPDSGPFPDRLRRDRRWDQSVSLPLNGGLPCTPMVTHADGRPVSNILPAQAGEELVAYATGLGATNPALTAGQPAAQSSPTVATFGIDFNFRANALATMPGAIGASTGTPLFTGATKGYIGLYQINFIVPTPRSACSRAWTMRLCPHQGWPLNRTSRSASARSFRSTGRAFAFDQSQFWIRRQPDE